MSLVNQRGDPAAEEAIMFPGDFEGDELRQAVLLLAERLGVEIIRTNATKHGDTQIQLKETT
jgi:DNA primase